MSVFCVANVHVLEATHSQGQRSSAFSVDKEQRRDCEDDLDSAIT